MKLNLQSFRAPRDGIKITLVNMHGDADAFTHEAIEFPLTPEGRQSAELLLSALPEVHDAVISNREGSTEDVCALLAKRLSLPYDPLLPLLEPLLRSDARMDDFFATPAGYSATLTQNGQVQQMLFGAAGAQSAWARLAPIHDTYFQQWENPVAKAPRPGP